MNSRRYFLVSIMTVWLSSLVCIAETPAQQTNTRLGEGALNSNGTGHDNLNMGSGMTIDLVSTMVGVFYAWT
jgi:hypothetical protein